MSTLNIHYPATGVVCIWKSFEPITGCIKRIHQFLRSNQTLLYTFEVFKSTHNNMISKIIMYNIINVSSMPQILIYIYI